MPDMAEGVEVVGWSFAYDPSNKSASLFDRFNQ